MFDAAVVPLLQREFPLQAPFVCRTLRTGGLGESAVQEKIKAPLDALVAAGVEVGYCARVGQVDVRLTATGVESARMVGEAESVVRKILGANIYGVDDEIIEEIVVQLLTAQKKTLALAESCTGGGIANRLTNIPGASAIFLGGAVSYSNAAKAKILGVRDEALAAHGAVSEAVAQEMAEGAREKFGADFAIAVTGIAGPGGGTAEKPVGTVFIALADASGVVVERRLNIYERAVFKELTAQQALEMLRQRLVST
jgi:nicotinamide-nucleotide amidase